MRNKPIRLAELIKYGNGQIRSRSLSKRLEIELPLVIYSVAKAESISAEMTSLTKIIQIIDGSLEVALEGNKYVLSQGEMLVVAPNTLHEIYGIDECKFLQIETK
ncbi:AraC family ligand binding domain-containing protein [Enterococcus sp. UD-01]|jgi:quercetin dioxygenase-like cupin family protein|uniref:AraC family ligand binding domain-containing protein n=1 Tax=Enterococcus sp. UD-01 TaxID=3373911 RepID=UPI00383582BF